MAKCKVCFRHCDIKENAAGLCGARTYRDGEVVASNYGRITSIALDPIEKKPLSRFCPGSKILSVGSYGCNLRCPFCQNSDISWSDYALSLKDNEDGDGFRIIMPAELADLAYHYKEAGNIGVAFTYNEPLIGYEYVRDTAKLVHEMGMKNVLVSNGTAEISILDEIGPYIDAMNIDLKGFTRDYYDKTLGGSFDMVKKFIEKAVTYSHVELTTLIVPGENDSDEEMRNISSWIAGLKNAEGDIVGENIPLHISRFFPRFKMTDRPATDVSHIYHLADIAKEKLKYVYTGNC